MARDHGLEDVLGEDLAAETGLITRPMFGGLVWLRGGHLCLGARSDGLLARLGPGQDAWALAQAGIRPMTVGPRPMRGWVRADPDVCADDVLRRRLLNAALAFVHTLAPKRVPLGAIPLDLLGVRDVPAGSARKR